MFYKAARGFMWALMRLIYRFKVEGVQHIPQTGAFILCSNHIHTLDPASHATCIKRRVGFMGKIELYRNRFKRPFLKLLGVIPVNRGAADMKAYRATLEMLNQGMGLFVFIQGTRLKEVEIKDAKGGAALFALKAQVPLIPSCVVSTYGLFSTIRIRYGPPIDLSQYKDQKLKSSVIDEVTALLMEEVRKLCQGT